MNVHKAKGFTLLEALITISIASIMMAIAAPSFISTIKTSRLVTQNNKLLTVLTLGKSEALKRGRTVTLCKRDIAGSSCENAANWQDGWILFIDMNNDAVIDVGESIIQVYDPLENDISLSYAFNNVTFSSLGFSEGYQGSFKFCDNRGASEARGLIIANTGQLSQADDSNSDGTNEDHTGANFTCP